MFSPVQASASLLGSSSAVVPQNSSADVAELRRQLAEQQRLVNELLTGSPVRPAGLTGPTAMHLFWNINICAQFQPYYIF